ncbi:hypothetical protein LUZ63_005962 [Rhynchospora breviuscula]|uniref:Uncharacterized protein n=1 Tax=Rhynchospora breviuscula TaxID=2022672 RepID=A0A9Q0CP02_9POAL|nr:hypothetical protein LUZ63_005962 [Rhynchospora breviuscula]
MSQQQNLQPSVSTNEEEEEEALSLSDFPLKPNSPSDKLNLIPNSTTDDFEFRISFSATETDFQAEMCAADDVFCNGTILPLRPSVSSRTDSMDLSISSGTILSTSRSASSSSSGSSSYCVSRSHSTKSVPGTLPIPDPPRRSVSNNFFYAFPSPSPQIRTGARKSNVISGRKSTSSVPGTILRLGVLPTPEIDIRSRRTNEKKPNTVEKKQLGFGGYGFGCNCVPDEVVEPVGMPVSRSKAEAPKKKKNGGEEEERKVEKKEIDLKFNLKRRESLCRTRIFNWFEELSSGKTSQN